MVLYSPTGKYKKTKIYQMAASRFVEVTDKEISKIKINSVPKNTKGLCKNTKTIIRPFDNYITHTFWSWSLAVINSKLRKVIGA